MNVAEWNELTDESNDVNDVNDVFSFLSIKKRRKKRHLIRPSPIETHSIDDPFTCLSIA